MKKTFKLILFFSLFLSLFSFVVKAQPSWSDNASFSPTNYSSSTLSEFYINWTSDVNMTFISITNSTGYVLANNSSMTNNSGNYSFSIVLPAGTFNWTSYANNSANVWNSSDTWTFTISQAYNPVRLYLNVTLDANKTYTYPQAINATAMSANGAVYLYRNASSVSNPDLVLLGNGTHEYFVNATGNENYTSNTTGLLFYAFVNKGASSIILYINGSSFNKNVNLNEIVNLTAASNVSGLNVSLYLNYTGYLDNFQNGTSPQTNLTNTSSLGIGFFNFSAQVLGNENYSNSSLGSLYFFVANISNNPSLPVNYSQNALYNFSIKLPINVSMIIFKANFNGSYVNYTNTINITNWNKTITMYNDSNGTYWVNFTDLPADTSYYYSWMLNDTGNVWFSTSQMNYPVNTVPITPTFYVSGNGGLWTVVTSSSVTLICQYSLASLSIAGLSCSVSNTSTASCTFTAPSAPSNSIYTCTASGNFSGTNQQTLTYALFNSSSGTTGGSGNQPSGSFSITTSSSNITMEPNSSSLITITIRNTFSYDITNINLTVSGINSSWYSLYKTSMSRLQHNIGVNTSTLTLTIPANAEQKSYTVIVTVVGRDFNLNRLTRQTSIFLTVYEQQNASYEINETNATNETNESTETAAVGSQSNGTAIFLSIFSMTPQVRNVIVFVALMCIALILIFRDNITRLLFKNQPHVEPKPEAEAKPQAETKSQEAKRLSLLHPIKEKIHSLSEQRLVIQIKKKEKKEEKA